MTVEIRLDTYCKTTQFNKVLHLIDNDINYIHKTISIETGLTNNDYYLINNGRYVLKDDKRLNGVVCLFSRLRGGKGGFGSMLRAIGAQIEKTTNREACRDLSGRRLRDINEEQRLKKWITQQAEREREVEERRKRKLEKLSQEPKHEFNDKDYDRERSAITEKLFEAVEEGMKASSSNIGSLDLREPVKKKKRLLLDIEDEFSSSEESDVSENSNSKKNDEFEEANCVPVNTDAAKIQKINKNKSEALINEDLTTEQVETKNIASTEEKTTAT